MSTTDELLANNAAYARGFDLGRVPRTPAKKVAVLTCMDARMNPMALLGLRDGDANVLRNAGGLVTDDAIRSLALSQHLLGTEEIVVIQHTGCGLMSVTDEEFARTVEERCGRRPDWKALAFTDLAASLRESMERLRGSAVLPNPNVRGFIYEIETGGLHEVR